MSFHKFIPRPSAVRKGAGLIPLNRVIKILVAYDFFLLFGWGLVMPILAIFIADSIQGGDAKVAGIAIGIYWLGKSILQIPIANYIDKNHGERDDYYVLIGGTILTALTPLGFLFASLPWHVYALQGIHALGMAFVIPSWSGIFTRHIDKGREALSWSFDSSSLGIGTGVASIIGGIIAKIFGFAPLFIGVTVMGFMTAALCLLIRNDLLPKQPDGKIYPIPKPH